MSGSPSLQPNLEAGLHFAAGGDGTGGLGELLGGLTSVVGGADGLGFEVGGADGLGLDVGGAEGLGLEIGGADGLGLETGGWLAPPQVLTAHTSCSCCSWPVLAFVFATSV